MVRKFLIFCLLPPLAEAGNVYTQDAYEVPRLVFYSKQESIYPEWQGTIQLIFSNINWSGGTCHSKSVAIRGEDAHIISALLAAKATGQKIHLYADDLLKIKNDYCFLRAISHEGAN